MSSPQKPIKLFCSYAHEDEPLLKKLETHLSLLKRQGLIATWYDRQITAGTEWAQAIDTHLGSASVILLLISPDFIASDYCYGIEMTRALERHKANEAWVIPVLLRPVNWKGAPFAHLQALPSNAKPVTSWSNRDEAFADVAAGIRRAIEDFAQISTTLSQREEPVKELEDAGKYQGNSDGTVQGQVIGNNPTVHQRFYATQDKATSPSTKPQHVWNIPYLRNDYFTGREEILAELHARFKANNATALSQRHAMSGLGGIGKTQTAVEYAYRYEKEYQSVLWARAESHETLTSSFVEIATLLDLPQKDEKDQTITVQAVKHWLQDNRGWLLILDNADEPAIVREFLPTKFAGHILLTTRAQAFGGLAQRIEVDTMGQDVGALLLLRRAGLVAYDASLDTAAPADIAIAREITKKLGGLPLALDQAGAYIEETGCRLQDYQQIYQQHRTQLFKERRGLVDDYPEPVATTWALSFARVEEKNAAAAELLRFCAFLAPDDIAVEMIAQGASHLGTTLEPVANDPYELNQAIEVLRAYSLVKRDPSTGALSIHRLVQAVLRDAMPDDEMKWWAGRAVLAVSEACPDVGFAVWSQWERYLPHALACAVWIEYGLMMEPEAASLLTKAGYYLDDRARYSEAEPLYLHALAICEHQLGPEQPAIASCLNNLAMLYDNQGKFEQAEPLHLRALDIHEKFLGPDHPDTATSLNNLAMLYDSQGKFEQAEPLHVRALKIREQQLGPYHPNTATSLGNLATHYYAQGKYKQAEPLFQQALAIHEKQLGPDHPEVATSLNNLAELYRAQGKYKQAEPLFQQALAIHEKQLGPDHPNTAQSLNNLASLYNNQGKYEQAEPLHVRALKIREQQLGPYHPNTANSLNNLALLYDHQGKYEQAESLLKRALAIHEKQLGPDHPNTAQSLNNLASLYNNQGKYEQAEPLHVRALKIREQQLGPYHPNTAQSLNNLAFLYGNQGKYSEAEPLYVHALTIWEQSLGPQHPGTQQTRQNYVSLLRAMGRDEEAKQLEEKP